MIGIVRRYKVKVIGLQIFVLSRRRGQHCLHTAIGSFMLIAFQRIEAQDNVIKLFITKILGSVSPGSVVCEPYLTLT